MTEDFFDTIRYDYSIDQKLEKWMASKVKLAFGLAKVQQDILEKLGYKNLAPLSIDYDRIWFYIKDDKFHTVDDGNGKSTYRRWEHLYGDILLCLNDTGYHLCEASTDEESKTYKVEDGEYYFLWDNDEYTVLTYMPPLRTQYCKDKFEYIKGENYVAIKYYEKKKFGEEFMSEEERLSERPRKDVIISRSKDICHIEVFAYFHKNKIVVEFDDTVIVYDTEFNILYENNNNYKIWEIEGMAYLIFPYDEIVFCLSDCRKIELKNNDKYLWNFVKTYKKILICYSEKHFPLPHNCYSDKDDWDYEPETPVRNTFGKVFDSNFNFLRDFNVKGKIVDIKEMGNTIAMEVYSTTYNEDDTENLFDLMEPNISKYDEEINENISIPITSYTYLGGGDLYILSTGCSSDVISSMNRKIRYGVCQKGIFDDNYIKVIDCNYDKIIPMPVKEDNNVYFVGIIGTETIGKCDFYINNELVFQGIPFNKGKAIRVLNSGYFIFLRDLQGRNRIIRDGKIIFSTRYNVANAYVQTDYDVDGNKFIADVYLIVISKNGLYGIYSSKKHLILPIKYSTIDIDEQFNIVLGEKVNLDMYDEELKKGKLKCMRKGEYMQIGNYIEKYDYVECKSAKVYGDEVYIVDTYNEHYYWNDGFSDYEIDDEDTSGVNVPSNWDDYSYEDSLYDALGGEMDAVWNID
ncbi:MAG: hypothetical protein IKW98_13065 [Prevotella sp.]|nr:hypothetical protein [Prevotella sp.]